jgi:hypothetical protein
MACGRALSRQLSGERPQMYRRSWPKPDGRVRLASRTTADEEPRPTVPPVKRVVR